MRYALMSQAGVRWLSVWLLATAVGGLAHADAAESKYTPEQFLRECKAGAGKLEERARHCRGRCKLISGGSINGFQRVYEIEFAVSDENLLLKTHHVLEKRKGQADKKYDYREIRGSNADYCFHISMNKDSGQYRLHEHVLAAERAGQILGGKIRNMINYWTPPAHATHTMGSQAPFPLTALFDHPTFRLGKLTDRERAGVRVVRAEFTARPGEPKTDPRVSWTRDKVFGWFEVAPDKGWSVRAYEFTYFAAGATPDIPLAKARVIGEIEYANGSDGLPVVSKFKESVAWLDLPPDGYIAVDEIEVEYQPTPEEEFRLTHYGLPEPVGMPALPKKGIPNYWWFLAGAGVFAVAAVAFRLLARRQRATHTPTAS